MNAAEKEAQRLRIQLVQRTGELRGVLLAVASLTPDDITPKYRQKMLALYEKNR